MEEAPRTGLATVAVILGTIAVAVSIVPFLGVYGIVPAILALVTGIAAKRRAANQAGAGRGRAVTAIWMGAIAVVLVIGQSLVVPVSQPVQN
ncbi:MAG: hypothetical protein M3161_07285 [Actinomycetota bacterium]|nr:hypothetical protein [Actinomycetota bacterium]